MKVSATLLVALVGTASAQIPGTWKLHPTVCTSCNAPALFDVNGSRAVVLLNSDTVSWYHREFFWRTYHTADWTKSWQLSVDTVTNKLADPDNAYFRTDQLRYYSDNTISVISEAIHVYSKDMGDTWTVGYRSRAPGVALYSGDPSTIIKLSTPQLIDEPHFIEASADSGFEYFKVQDVNLQTIEHLFGGCFASAGDIWAGITSWPDSTRASYIWHTEDGGANWERSYPIDSSAGSWNRSSLGIHGFVPGAQKRTLYLIGNLYHVGLPDFRMIDILRTTDNGRAWYGDSTNFDIVNRADSNWGFATKYLFNPSGTQLWSVFWNKHTIAYSPNNGKNWYYDSASFKDEDIYLMRWKDSVHGYVVTYTDSVVRFYEYILPAVVERGNSIGPPITPISSLVKGIALILRTEQYFEGQLSIADMLGREVLALEMMIDPSMPSQTDIGSLPPGVYLVTLRNASGTTSFRILKQ